jgi:hypothetical protein
MKRFAAAAAEPGMERRQCGALLSSGRRLGRPFRQRRGAALAGVAVAGGAARSARPGDWGVTSKELLHRAHDLFLAVDKAIMRGTQQ